MQDNTDAASEATGFSTVWIRNVGDVLSQAFTDVVEHTVPNLTKGIDAAN